MAKFNVTGIQFFDYSNEEDQCAKMQYSANVFINDTFVIQVSGNENEAEKAEFAPSSSCYLTTEDAQEAASDDYDIDEIIEQIEENGFENNFYYLSKNGELF